MTTSTKMNSPTYDFLSGFGGNLARPTNEEYARRLFEITDRLGHWDVLCELSKSHPYERKFLHQALKKFMPERVSSIKGGFELAEEKMSPRIKRGENGDRQRIYVAQEPTRSVWFLITISYPHSSEFEVRACEEITTERLAQLMDEDVRDYYEPLAHYLLRTLIERSMWLRKRMERRAASIGQQSNLLELDQRLFKAAHAGASAQGDGIESW